MIERISAARRLYDLAGAGILLKSPHSGQEVHDNSLYHRGVLPDGRNAKASDYHFFNANPPIKGLEAQRTAIKSGEAILSLLVSNEPQEDRKFVKKGGSAEYLLANPQNIMPATMTASATFGIIRDSFDLSPEDNLPDEHLVFDIKAGKIIHDPLDHEDLAAVYEYYAGLKESRLSISALTSRFRKC